jgi:hypothetical protein
MSRVVISLRSACELKAGHARHVVVVSTMSGGFATAVAGVLAVDRRFDVEALAPQAIGDQVADRRRIIDHEHVLARARHARGEQRVQATDQLLGHDRLDQIIVGAGVEAFFQICCLTER